MSDEPERMKLGMVLKGYPRISETFISNEIRLLEKMGFDIHIFSMREPRESFTHGSVREIRAGVTYLPESMVAGLPAMVWNTLACMVERPGRFFSGLKLMAKRFRLAPKKHTWLKHWMQACFLVRKAKGMGLAHLHCHFAHTPTTVGMYAAHLEAVPFSFTAHAKDIYTQAPERILDKLDLAKFVVTCTKYNERHLSGIAPTNKPVHCVYHGINLKLFDPEGRPLTAEPPYTVMTVARFVPKKGLDTVLKALRILRDRGLDVRYVLAGDGADRDIVEGWIHEMNLSDVTETTGTIAHEQVLEHYRSSDLFVLGCRMAEDGDRDGIPNVVAESMAIGVPVAATDVSGVPELVHHGETGMLCPPDQPETLADNMQHLLTDADLRAKIIPAARQKVLDVFDNEKLIHDLGEIYISHQVPCPGRS